MLASLGHGMSIAVFKQVFGQVVKLRLTRNES